MKRLSIIVAMIVAIVFLAAEPAISTYTTMEKQLSVKLTNDGDLLIEVLDLSYPAKTPHVRLLNKDVPAMRAYLAELKQKHVDWQNAFSTSGKDSFTKTMPLSSPCPSVWVAWVYAGKWRFSPGNTKFIPIFTADKDGCASSINVATLQDISNEYIEFGQTTLCLFVGPDEVQSLYDALDSKHVSAYREEQSKENELFK